MESGKTGVVGNYGLYQNENASGRVLSLKEVEFLVKSGEVQKSINCESVSAVKVPQLAWLVCPLVCP